MRYEIKDIKPPERIKTAMQLQSESERVKRSRILASEGKMQSEINIAEGLKQTIIYEGQSGAEKILLEAKALVQAIKEIGNALISDDGRVNANAMKLRLTDTYLETLNRVYSEVKLVGLPKGGAAGDASGGMNAETLATAIVLSKHISGGAGPGSDQKGTQGPDMSGENVQALQS